MIKDFKRSQRLYFDKGELNVENIGLMFLEQTERGAKSSVWQTLKLSKGLKAFIQSSKLKFLTKMSLFEINLLQ